MKNWMGFRLFHPAFGWMKVYSEHGDGNFIAEQEDLRGLATELTESDLRGYYERQLLEEHPGVLLDLMSLPKDLKFSKEQMEAIEYADFERYTRDNGWNYPRRVWNSYFARIVPYTDDAPFATFPVERLDDYGIRVSVCIQQLAEADERSMMSVYLELRWKIKEP